MCPGHPPRWRHDHLEPDQAQVPAFARTQHQAVRAEGDSVAVAICRSVVDPEAGHRQFLWCAVPLGIGENRAEWQRRGGGRRMRIEVADISL
jgi:hypothetical protein